MFKKLILNFWPQLLIILVVFTFFNNLFFSEPSLFVTPDFGRSDALHSNIPAKLDLSKSLKSLTLPTWNYRIGQGFPVLAEGIIGTFYLPNLILFFILPNNFVIPVQYVTTFSLAAVGVYLLLLYLKLSKSSSIIGAISYTFCASMILHVQHINFIQAASLLPFIMLFVIKLIKKPNKKNALILVILYSQLFFTGFVQIFVYSAIIFFGFMVLYLYKTKGLLLKVSTLFIIVLISSLIISSAQLLPSLELNNRSLRSEGLEPSYVLSSFPMGIEDIAKFINPFILGQAKNGTANSTNWEVEGVYWESTNYIGIISLVLAVLSIAFLLKDRNKKTFIIIAILAAFTMLLSLGKYAPTHIFYSFLPLSLFRVPSRFLLLTQLFLALLAAYGAKRLIDIIPEGARRPVSLLLVILVVIDLFVTWWSYNPVGSFRQWTQDPQTAQVIKSVDKLGRVISFGGLETWNNLFTEVGWANKINDYYYFRNSLDANSNDLYDVAQFNMFETLPTRRYGLQNRILLSEIKFENNEILINETAKNILDNSNTRFIISTRNVSNNGYKQIFETGGSSATYKVFESDKKIGYGKVFYDFKTVNSPDDYAEVIKNTNLDTTVILEKSPSTVKFQTTENSVSTKSIANGVFNFEVKSESPGIFVLSNSYFPGWKATVDGKTVEIIAANINHQAIELPAGLHAINFSYEPPSLRLGLAISIISYLVIVIYLLRLSKKEGHSKT